MFFLLVLERIIAIETELERTLLPQDDTIQQSKQTTVPSSYTFRDKIVLCYDLLEVVTLPELEN